MKQPLMNPRLHFFAFVSWLFVSLMATTLAEPIRVAVGVIETDSVEYGTVLAADNLQALLISALSTEPGVEVLERDKMDDAMKELGLQLAGSLASTSGIAVGRWLNAEILIAGTEVWDGKRRTRIDFEFIDLLNGDVLARTSAPLAADAGKELRLEGMDIDSLQKNLSATLRSTAAMQRQLRGRTRIAPLFFFNDEPGLHDLDLVEEAFKRAAEAQNRTSGKANYTLFPRAVDAANERALRLDGLALPRGDGVADLADCYVWGFFKELPASDVPFPAVPIAVTLHLWRPSGELTILRETMPVGSVQERIDALLGRITALALDPKARGLGTEKMELSANDLAFELFRAARLKSEALQPSMLSFQRTASDLYRWGAIRQLVATAHFFDPANWLIAREVVIERHNKYFSIGEIAMKPHPRDRQRGKKQELQAAMDFLHFIRRYGPHPLSLEGKMLTRDNKDFVRLIPGETLRPGELEDFRAGKNIGLLVPYVRPANQRNGFTDNRLPNDTLFVRMHKMLLEHVQALPEPARTAHLAEWQMQLVSDFSLLATGVEQNGESVTRMEWKWLADEIPSVASHLPIEQQRKAVELWLPLFVSKEQEISDHRLAEWRSLIEKAFAAPTDSLASARWLTEAEKMKPKPRPDRAESHGRPDVAPAPTPTKPPVLDLPRLAVQPEKVIDLNYDDARKIYKKHHPEMVKRMGGIVDLDSHGVRAMVCTPGQLHFATDSGNSDATGALPGIWSWRFGAATPDFLTLDLGIESRIKTLLTVGDSCWLLSEGAGVFSLDRSARFTQKDGLPTETVFAAATSDDRIYVGGGEELRARFGYYSLTGQQWTAVATHPMNKGPLPRIMELAASGPFVAALGSVRDSYLHVFDTDRKTWSDLWPELAKHLGESGESWERSARRAEPRFTAVCGESGGYWIGSSRGLFHYDPRARKFRTFAVPGALCPDKIIATERLIVVAAALPGHAGSELLFLSKASGKWLGSIPLEPVTALATGEGFLWIGTDRGSAAKGARIFRVPLTAFDARDLPE